MQRGDILHNDYPHKGDLAIAENREWPQTSIGCSKNELAIRDDLDLDIKRFYSFFAEFLPFSNREKLLQMV